MRIFSSQIQEWIVEFTCDKLFITIRTDVAWYRLARYSLAALNPCMISIPFPWSLYQRVNASVASQKYQ